VVFNRGMEGKMKERFVSELHLGKKNIEKLGIVNDIIKEYLQQGYRLTLRQLYYQLVSRDIIPNSVKEYGKLSGLLVKGRMAGHVDWEAIEDRIRIPKLPYYAKNIQDAMSDIVGAYRLNRQDGQDVYIEVWVEKDALSGVLLRVTRKYHINLMVNRGYSSCTAMHDAYQRFDLEDDKERYILYLGDHDPSGLDMIRDVKDRLGEFGLDDINVIPVALTHEQIKKYKPPPNPAKVTDPRANDYISEYGRVSWEVDALNPKILNSLLEKAILDLIDEDKYEEMLEKEKEDIAEIKEKFDME